MADEQALEALQVAKQLAERRVDEGRAEARALREALEALLDALDESHGGTFDPYPGRLMTAYTDARALAPEPAESA